MLFVPASSDVHTRLAPSCRPAPTYKITVDLPEGASLYADKDYNDAIAEALLALDGLRLIPIRKKNMQPREWTDEYDLRLYRTSIETVNSQLESLGLQRLRARTNEGFDIKVILC